MSGSLAGGFSSPDRGPAGAGPMSLQAFLAALPPTEVKRARRWLIAVGIVATITGVVAIVVPIAASVTMTLFIGWLLMFWGVLGAVQAIRGPAPRSAKAWRMVDAVLALLIGFYLVVLPLSGTITLTFLLAVWFFGTGLLSLWSAWQHRHAGGVALTVVNGVLSLILGLLIAVNLPSSAAWAIGLLVGFYMLWWGTGALVAAFLTRRLGH
ncbi:HdeD family acid-resistance protein [Baekduia sp. Peel2402]|uniref:HdeD family acid-resistance protein n=1 Tax=Baekduia sp. Peel2402 TaxID=3458296 RepID=UPI00403E9631